MSSEQTSGAYGDKKNINKKAINVLKYEAAKVLGFITRKIQRQLPLISSGKLKINK